MATELPYAILRPKQTSPRSDIYKVYADPQPLSPTNQLLMQQLRPFLTGEPVVVDLETEGTRAEMLDRKVAAVSLANGLAVASWNCRGEKGQKMWRQMLGILSHRRIPLIAHNLVFDVSWMLRDLNMDEQGRLPRWANDWKRFNLRYCTLGLFRQLASEGFPGQKYGLADAQTHLLLWQETNKRERNRRLIEQGLIRKKLPKGLGQKLMGVEGYEQYANQFQLGQFNRGGGEEDNLGGGCGEDTGASD